LRIPNHHANGAEDLGLSGAGHRTQQQRDDQRLYCRHP
jgi:hypothetical protein